MPRKNNINSKQGFTIIEVVLVLAVAGLIFLMVFIALPSLQRTQRDTQRRNDYAMLATAVTNYIANNGGKLSKLITTDPNEGLDTTKWLNTTGEDPNGYPYELIAISYSAWLNGSTYKTPEGTVKKTKATCSVANKTDKTSCESAGGKWTDATGGDPGSQVFIVVNANCNGVDNNTGSSIPDKDNASRAFAIYGYLESGTYCQDVGRTQ